MRQVLISRRIPTNYLPLTVGTAALLCAVRPIHTLDSAALDPRAAATAGLAGAHPGSAAYGLQQSQAFSRTPPKPPMTDTAVDGKRVALHYTGTLEDGTVFDSSEGKDPIEFDVGKGKTVVGTWLDAGVRGMIIGESKTIAVDPANAYGEYDNSKMQQVDASRLPEGSGVGTALQAGSQRMIVAKIEDGVATLDGNHELAGKTLTFQILVTSITDSPEPFRSTLAWCCARSCLACYCTDNNYY